MKNKKLIVSLLVLFSLTGCELKLTPLPNRNSNSISNQMSESPSSVDYGQLVIDDITLLEETTKVIDYEFTIEDRHEEIEYFFLGNYISIENGVVRGLVGGTTTEVVARTKHHETTFNVIVEIEYGTLSIANVNVDFNQECPIIPVFSKENRSEEITYTFEGNNISINDGIVKGLVPETTTMVKAVTEHHEATFEVNVDYVSASLTKDNGAESKFSLPIPSNEDNYIFFIDVEVEEYRQNGFTRMSSFAFNGSDNSWYNIELNSAGDAILYARFNGVEKYNIHLFNINEEGIIVDGKINYSVAILVKGQETRFYINDKYVCFFTSEEMKGYANLSSLEVTAAADRDNAGSYKINLSKVYFELDENQKYSEYEAKAFSTTLKNYQGVESKYSYGNLGATLGNFLYSAKVVVNEYDPELTRTSSFAFNGSDNSWYNIEMNNVGDFTLYARFNGVEKYHIHLFNANDEGIIVNGKITYTVNLLKEGEATYFFVNDKLVCSFSALELNGYASLNSFEVTAATDASWRDGNAYSVTVESLIKDGNSDEYKAFANKTSINYEDSTLISNEGHETKYSYGQLSMTHRSFIYSSTVVVNNEITKWTRPTAFAFNGSDNSWYNIETDGSGNYTLYARFNGVEKYHIHLFNANDEGIKVDGKVTYTVNILKEGQATYFFVNDRLVCSFSSSELNGYGLLDSLEVSACANREATSYDVSIKNAKIESSTSTNYVKYLEKTNVSFENNILESNDGGEQKFVYGNFALTHNSFLLSTKVVVNNEITKWTRPTAFAFNGSDNSWYNIETDGSGNYTLYARFNGVEKYHIHLFNANDEGIKVDGKVTYTVNILKEEQATYFFVNDQLVCSFSSSELNGYGLLDSLEVSACANRETAAYNISLENMKLLSSSSNEYQTYLNKTR